MGKRRHGNEGERGKGQRKTAYFPFTRLPSSPLFPFLVPLSAKDIADLIHQALVIEVFAFDFGQLFK